MRLLCEKSSPILQYASLELQVCSEFLEDHVPPIIEILVPGDLRSTDKDDLKHADIDKRLAFVYDPPDRSSTIRELASSNLVRELHQQLVFLIMIALRIPDAVPSCNPGQLASHVQSMFFVPWSATAGLMLLELIQADNAVLLRSANVAPSFHGCSHGDA